MGGVPVDLVNAKIGEWARSSDIYHRLEVLRQRPRLNKMGKTGWNGSVQLFGEQALRENGVQEGLGWSPRPSF